MKALIHWLKIIGIVVGIGTGVMGGVGIVWKVGAWVADSARASEVRENRERVVRAEVRLDAGERQAASMDRKLDLVLDQLVSIARTVRAPVLKSDAPR